MHPAVTVPFRRAVGLLAGMPTGLAGLGWSCVAWPVARSVGGGRARRVTAALVELERTRLATWYDHHCAGDRGGNAYLALRGALGLLGGYLAAAGLFVAVLLLHGGAGKLLSGDPGLIPLEFPGVRLTGSSWAYGLALGLAALALSVAWGAALVTMDCRLADRFAGPHPDRAAERRIAELTASRSGIVRAVDDERRRIERDLHDGVQQRGVALAMLLGRARRTADPALIDEAYAESRLLLDELRDVAWRIYPTELDASGLGAALEEVADRSAVPVTFRHALPARLAPEIETAAYFMVREAITNANKHAGASAITVGLRREGDEAVVTVSDDGRGGADGNGGGLSGLARRVRALDGTFAVDSPPGGPTTVTARLPCA
ncbi:signal transduction histidine kinase [Streptosporangium becharense]|uniref:histidine kinase n=1 Tax=Streptosporangium becharense TaxID=1816182 RepID=A0A7W9IH04_9ACTN|nr:ATP-binding protein [Streptosporangium becharense]MBB2912576.1 signal transduction histidine kinase [Streptosporangium becharense]MBB5820594.1 signal transduction histidine kinase [Streptosporangium becharense]